MWDMQIQRIAIQLANLNIIHANIVHEDLTEKWTARIQEIIQEDKTERRQGHVAGRAKAALAGHALCNKCLDIRS